MDLLAYEQIEELEELAKRNGINIPRLRGYDLCSDMKPWTKEEKRRELNWIEYDCCEDLCTSAVFWNPNDDTHCLNNWTDFIKEYYLDEENRTIRWNRIHGWKRRVLKTYIHNRKKKFFDYVKVWDSYCGKENILRVHSRMGGDNWNSLWWDENGNFDISKRNEVISAPWFIEKIDDYFDSTYCDIYCKLEK